MHLPELQDALRQSPFIPFRLYISGGESFDIRHPELCMPGIRAAIIGFQAKEAAEPAFDRYTVVDMGHIIRLEPLDSKTKADAKA